MVPMTLAVIIATADRPDSIAETLGHLAKCEVPGGGELHVIVADNGSGGATEQVCRERFDGLQVEHLKTSPGKSRALNLAADHANADLLVFTDDDVNPSPGWLVELERAAREYPEHLLFGGPITPLWPDDMPDYLDGSIYLGHLFSRLESEQATGPTKELRPFGPNMALRREAFERGVRFDETIGPGTETSMGDDTQITRQVARLGQAAVYVSAARVFHRVRPDQLSLLWQLGRGVRYGRVLAHQGQTGVSRVFGVPRWAIRAVPEHCLCALWKVASGDRTAAFDELMEAALAIGQIRQARSRVR